MKDQILARIEDLGPGKSFMAKDFLDIASRGSVDVALASLASSGKIRRIRRGLYDLPVVNPDLGGELSPDIDEAARTIARRNRWKIIPAGSWAANLLGLSTQVPPRSSIFQMVRARTFPSEDAPFSSNMPSLSH